MGNPIDITGKRFARLTAIDFRRVLKGNRSVRLWRCRCDCGNTTEVPIDRLRSGETRSCGCLRAEAVHTKHGHARKNELTSEYIAWQGLKARCLNPHDQAWPYYGGRGITVCGRWQSSFEAFLDDMGHRPSKHHSIDRIDNERGYEPSNCRWATRSEQAFNRRPRQYDGKPVAEGMTASEIAKIAGVTPAAIRRRIDAGYSGSDLFASTKTLMKRRKPTMAGRIRDDMERGPDGRWKRKMDGTVEKRP